MRRNNAPKKRGGYSCVEPRLSRALETDQVLLRASIIGFERAQPVMKAITKVVCSATFVIVVVGRLVPAPDWPNGA